MVICPDGLTRLKAYVKITIADAVIETPFVNTVNVSRSRGRTVSSANIQFEYKKSEMGAIESASNINIRFFNTPVFTGYIKRMNTASSLAKADHLIVRILAEDAMFKLQNKRIIRRQKQNGIGPVVFLSSIYRRPYFGFDDPTMVHDIQSGFSPVHTLTYTPNIAENTQYVKNVGDVSGNNHPVTKVADSLWYGSSGAGGGGGFLIHDHSELSTTDPYHSGGPSSAVFGIS